MSPFVDAELSAIPRSLRGHLAASSEKHDECAEQNQSGTYPDEIYDRLLRDSQYEAVRRSVFAARFAPPASVSRPSRSGPSRLQVVDEERRETEANRLHASWQSFEVISSAYSVPRSDEHSTQKNDISPARGRPGAP